MTECNPESPRGGLARRVGAGASAPSRRFLPVLALWLAACGPGPGEQAPALLDSAELGALHAFTAGGAGDGGPETGMALTEMPAATAIPPHTEALEARGAALRARAAALRGAQGAELDQDDRLRSRAEALRMQDMPAQAPDDEPGG